MQLIENIFQFQNMIACSGLNHCVTTKIGGVSMDSYSTLNLSFHSGDEEARVIENRNRVSAIFGLPADRLVVPIQEHTNNVKLITEANRGECHQGVDALITSTPCVVIGVLAADCVPILIHDPVNHVVASVHAGWKGTVQNIVDQTIQLMSSEFGTHASDLVVGIGPSISQTNYQVGTEVISKVAEIVNDVSLYVKRQTLDGKGYLDLWRLNVDLLVQSGVELNNIEVSGFCTFAHEEHYFSARRDGFYSGRFGAFIGLK